jgi:uncharacterized protein YukE
MDSSPAAGFRVDSSDLEKLIKSCENASGKIAQILHTMNLQGQSAQEWAGDSASLDIADHYVQQLWAGAYCTYSTLDHYHKELRAAIVELQRTRAIYANFDSGTSDTLEQL